MSSNKKSFCDLVHEALADEEKAQLFYKQVTETIQAGGIKSPAMAGIVTEVTDIIRKQEETHDAFWTYIKDRWCTLGTTEDQKEEQAKIREEGKESEWD